jgi:hypothetical protein
LLANKAEIVPHGFEVDFSPCAGRGLSHGADDKWNLGIRNSQFFRYGFSMPTSMIDYEKLGSFYLGKKYDIETREVTD